MQPAIALLGVLAESLQSPSEAILQFQDDFTVSTRLIPRLLSEH